LLTSLKPSWKAGDYADKDGQFRRPDSIFRSSVSSDPSAEYPAEAGRYVLYVNYGCPWAHRTILTRGLKKLEDIIQLIEVDGMTEGKGWTFTGQTGPDKDPLYGGKYLRDLYEKASPAYEGRITVPVLWDKKKGLLVIQFRQMELTLFCRDNYKQREQRDHPNVL
jgi:glutathionyl-hydroquinone reductase